MKYLKNASRTNSDYKKIATINALYDINTNNIGSYAFFDLRLVNSGNVYNENKELLMNLAIKIKMISKTDIKIKIYYSSEDLVNSQNNDDYSFDEDLIKFDIETEEYVDTVVSKGLLQIGIYLKNDTVLSMSYNIENINTTGECDISECEDIANYKLNDKTLLTPEYIDKYSKNARYTLSTSGNGYENSKLMMMINANNKTVSMYGEIKLKSSYTIGSLLLYIPPWDSKKYNTLIDLRFLCPIMYKDSSKGICIIRINSSIMVLDSIIDANKTISDIDTIYIGNITYYIK